MLAHNQHACRQQRWRTVCHSLLKSLQSKIISSRLLSKRFEHDIRRASRPVTGESAAKVARSALSAAAAATAFRAWFIREMGKSRNKRRYHFLVMVIQMND
jgi:hypothetical protein